MFSGEIISKVKRHKKTYLFIYFFHKKQNELLCLRAAQHAVHDFLQFSLNIMIGCCVMSPCGKTSPSFFCFIAFYLNGICVVNVGPRLDSDDKHVFICFFFLFPFCFCILNVRIFSFLDILNVYLVNFDVKSTETTGGGGNSTGGCFGWLDLDWIAQAICVFWSVLWCFLGGCCWCSLPFWRLSVAVLRSVVLWVNHPPRSQQRNRARYRQDVWLLMDVETRFHSAVYNSRLRKNTLWKVLPSDVSLWARELDLRAAEPEGRPWDRKRASYPNALRVSRGRRGEEGSDGEGDGDGSSLRKADRQTDEAWKRKPEKERRPVLCWSACWEDEREEMWAGWRRRAIR